MVLKVKIIVNKSNEARVPKLLVDFVLQDAALQLSRKQFVSLMEIAEFMKLAEINRSKIIKLSDLFFIFLCQRFCLLQIVPGYTAARRSSKKRQKLVVLRLQVCAASKSHYVLAKNKNAQVNLYLPLMIMIKVDKTNTYCI